MVQRRSWACFRALVTILSVVAPAGGFAICNEEWQRHYDAGNEVAERYAARSTPCLDECVREKLGAFERAVQLCPTSDKAQTNLADALENLGRYVEADAHYRQAVALNPKRAEAYFGLGDLSFGAQAYAKAVAYYDQGLAISPDDGIARRQRNAAACMQEHPTAYRTCIEAVLGRPVTPTGPGRVTVMGPGQMRGDRYPGISLPIPFAYNDDTLPPEASPILEQLGPALKAISDPDPTAAFGIEGHTDIRGSEEYNFGLSERRARRVRAALVSRFGLPPDTLAVRGFGKSQLRSTRTTEADHAVNRRVEVKRYHSSQLALLRGVGPAQSPASQEEGAASLSLDVGVFYEGPESRPKKLEDNAVLRTGDGYRIYFEAKRRCYVYILQSDATGKVFHLYPNPDYGTHDNLVEPHRAYWVPGDDKWIELDQTRGEEVIYVVATKERRDVQDILDGAKRRDDGEQVAGALREESHILTMGPKWVRPGRTVDVASRKAGPVQLDTNQLQHDGAAFAYRITFRHE